MPRLVKIYSAVDHLDGNYLADVEIDFSDHGGGIERCPYGCNAHDKVPINQEIWGAIQAGLVKITELPPPEQKPIPDKDKPHVSG